MTGKDLYRIAENLENRINGASPASRLALQPELHRVLERLKADGKRVPRRLQMLDAALCEEAIEAWFDNMPV